MTLATQRSALEANGLILLARLEPEIEYLFRHALIQEAAYQSLPKSQRLGLHRAVRESLEQSWLSSKPAAATSRPRSNCGGRRPR